MNTHIILASIIVVLVPVLDMFHTRAVLAAGSPHVLFYHSFDQSLERPDIAVAPAVVRVSPNVISCARGAYGRAAEFPPGASEAAVRVELSAPAPAEGWTVALFNCLTDKVAMVTPDRPLLAVLDQNARPMLTVNVSGLVKVLDASGRELAAMDCLDATYWIGGEKIHLAFTYEADGAEGSTPRGKLTAYWSARPYGCLYADLGQRQPTSLVLGGDDVNTVVDELYLFDAPLPRRAIYELARPPRKDISTLNLRLAEIVAAESMRPDAVRRAAWRAAVKGGQVFEAESILKPLPAGQMTNCPSASNHQCVELTSMPAAFSLETSKAGQYSISLRYALARTVDLMWPVRHPEAKTAWTHDYTTIEVLLNGQKIGTKRLYPTGIYNGHSGDVEPWAWTTLAEKVTVPAGQWTLELRRIDGQGKLLLDAVLVSQQTAPEPPYPRWVDQYRIPPAWWVAEKKTYIEGNTRIDKYTIELRNRTDEPYACTIELEHDMLGEGQVASADTTRLELPPHESKPFHVLFRTPAERAGSSGYVRVVLWNEDVCSTQEYRIWNFIPQAGFEQKRHPTLVPPPDPQMQARFRHWLKTRDPAALTPELKQWAAGPDLSKAAPEYKVLAGGTNARLNVFGKPLLGDQLDKLDFWMSLSPEQFERFLPDASAETHGYGTCWDQVANQLTGAWYGRVRVTELKPPMSLIGLDGDLDLVTEFTAEGQDVKTGVTRTATWHRDKDPHVFMALRLIRAGLPIGYRMSTQTSHEWHDAGLRLLAEAYFLTGDEAYARQAAKLALIFARKYTFRTKQFFEGLHREDRDWWGTRLGNRYAWRSSVGDLAMLGTIILDLCWDALDEEQRNQIEHNLVRWGMHDVCAGNMWDDPDKQAKVNYEDMPSFIAFACTVGDAGPYHRLLDYRDRLNQMVHPDGVHICSIGSYGGVATYISFMQGLASLGVDVVTDNPRLRNAFLNHTRFIFSCGSVQPMDDGGGGQNHLGLGPVFGAPSAEHYQWGYELYKKELLKIMPEFLSAMGNATRGKPAERAKKMRAFYGAGEPAALHGSGVFPIKTIWPDVFVAEVKGMAMLRNRHAADPLDWIEVLFDYGKYGGRFHGHPTKLSILTAYNGQIGSQDYGDLTRCGPEGNNAWFMGGYSHNTVQVDYRGHRTAGGPVQIGQLISAGGDQALQWIDAHSDRMFPGIYMRRTTFVTDVAIVDFYLCKSHNEHVYDWLYHNFGIASTELPLTPKDLSDQGLLRFVKDARSGKNDGLIQVTWKDQPLSVPPRKGQTSLIDEEVFARLWVLPEANTELFLFAGPTVSTINEEKEIDYAMLRRKTNSTVFAAVIEPWRASTGPKLRSVGKLPVLANGKPVPDTEACAIAVERINGQKQVFLVNYSGGEKTLGKITTDSSTACWLLGPDDQVINCWHSSTGRRGN